jgi:hypothetical protein
MKRWGLVFLGVVLVLIGGVAGESLWLDRAYETHLEALTSSEEHWQRLSLALTHEPMDIAPTDLEALKADPEVYTLVERVRQGLDTEADLRRLSEAIQKRWEALRGERRKMYELYKQRRLLWRLGVVVLALVLLGWGGWRLYLDYKQSADAAAAFRQVLEAWHQGRWQADSVSLPQAQTLAHLWQTVEESLNALEKGELPHPRQTSRTRLPSASPTCGRRSLPAKPPKPSSSKPSKASPPSAKSPKKPAPLKTSPTRPSASCVKSWGPTPGLSSCRKGSTLPFKERTRTTWSRWPPDAFAKGKVSSGKPPSKSVS